MRYDRQQQQQLQPQGSSSILSQPWLLPALSIVAATTFIAIHITSQGWSKLPSGGTTVQTGREQVGGGGGLQVDSGGNLKPFTYTPTSAPQFDTNYVPVPTTVVIGHHIPGIDGGTETSPPVPLTWNIPLGEPTPDPALLSPYPPPNTPIPFTWNISSGEPTPDPALLLDPATPPNLIHIPPTNAKWNIPEGEPTPDPVLLYSTVTSPSETIKKWNIPKGEPTPDPIQLNNPATSPLLYTNLLPPPSHWKWNIPEGEPTPDPALLHPPGTPSEIKKK